MTHPEIPEEALDAAIVAAGHTTLDGDRPAQIRAALTAALPHLRVQETAGLDPAAVMRHYHQEFCEYDGAEDGVPVCAGECREFVEAVGTIPTPRPVVDREAVIAALHNYDHGHRWGEPICERYACEHIYPARADVVLALLPTGEDTKGASHGQEGA